MKALLLVPLLWHWVGVCSPLLAQWTLQYSGGVPLTAVKAVSSTVAWAGGNVGTVLRTTDGGVNWTSAVGGGMGTANIIACEALDENVAFVSTRFLDSTWIYRTTNGGTTWAVVFVQVASGASINALRMFNTSEGIAVGNPVGGRWTILKTTNGGATWVRDTVHAPLQFSGEQGTPNGFSAVGTRNIWFSSEYSSIFRSTDAGETWLRIDLPFVYIVAAVNLWFNTASSGIITSYEFKCLNCPSLAGHSTDGGSTWVGLTPLGQVGLPRCGGFGDSDFFYSQGGTIYRSRNAGANFDTSYVGTGFITGLNFVRQGQIACGWAVTFAGGILAFSENAMDVDIRTIPEGPTLFQNYPNPFNPSTRIPFSVPISAFTSLKVYDVLGREVATLVNEVKQPGSYEVSWDASGLASGVYLYRMQAGEFTQAKRLLLLK